MKLLRDFRFIKIGNLGCGWTKEEKLIVLGHENKFSLIITGNESKNFDKVQLEAYERFDKNREEFQKQINIALLDYYKKNIYKYKDYIMFYLYDKETSGEIEEKLFNQVNTDEEKYNNKLKKVFEEKYSEFFPKTDTLQELEKLNGNYKIKNMYIEYEYEEGIREICFEVNNIWNTDRAIYIQFKDEKLVEIGDEIEIVGGKINVDKDLYFKFRKKGFEMRKEDKKNRIWEDNDNFMAYIPDKWWCFPEDDYFLRTIKYDENMNIINGK